MSEIKWIKITTNIFDDEKIMFLEEMPESDTLIVIWFKLLAIAGKKNDCGLIYLTKDIPYDDTMLLKIIRRPLNIIKLALKTFEKLGMIEIVNNVIAIKNWEKHQNIEGMEKLKIQWRDASKKYRERQKTKLLENNHNSSYDDHNTEKIRLDKIRLDKNNRERKKSSQNTLSSLKEIPDKTNKKKEKIIRTGYGEFTNVFLTQEEYSKLVNRYGDDNINKKIESMSTWLKAKGKRYKDYYSALLNWLKKDGIKEISGQQEVKYERVKSLRDIC